MTGVDKIWAPLGDRPVVRHCLDRLSARASVVVLVVQQGQEPRAERELLPSFPQLRIVPG